MSAIGLRTLVLNANYLPISIFPLQTIPVEDAVTRVFNGTCNVVLEHNRDILTPNLNMKWPSVIARIDSSKVLGKVKLSLEALYYRDHGVCMYCEKSLKIHEITCDHVVPKSKGGAYSWDNIVSACSSCNLKKGDHAPVGQWKPKQSPYKPSYYQLLNMRRKFPIVVDDHNWMQFLGDWESDVIVKKVA
jgi:5-methylcytosine-specific restriction endonuclease McrA